MNRIRTRLAGLVKRLATKKALLARARRRYKANRKRAYAAHGKQLKAQERADKLRQTYKFYGTRRQIEAEQADREALRFNHVAYRNHMKAQYWLGQTKLATQKIHGLEAHQDKVKAELAKWKKEHGVVIEGNKVVGGAPGQRWRAALLASVANCSKGMPQGRRNFYSQSGSWDIDHEIKGGPEYGNRSDCSSTVTGWAKACGLPDPNGEDFHGGYTGTLVGQHNGWKEVSQHFMETSGKPAYIVYGPGPGHHTEGYLGPGIRTAGHGDARVDFGVVDDFGDGDFRCFAYMG